LREKFLEQHGPSHEPETLADIHGAEPQWSFEVSTGADDNLMPVLPQHRHG